MLRAVLIRIENKDEKSQTPGPEHLSCHLPETTSQLSPGFPWNSSRGMEERIFDLRQRIPLNIGDKALRLRIDKAHDLIACIFSLACRDRFAVAVQRRGRDGQRRVRCLNGEPSATHVRLRWMNVGTRAILVGLTMRAVIGGRMKRRRKRVNRGLVVPSGPQRTHRHGRDRGGCRIRLTVRLVRGVPG